MDHSFVSRARDDAMVPSHTEKCPEPLLLTRVPCGTVHLGNFPEKDDRLWLVDNTSIRQVEPVNLVLTRLPGAHLGDVQRPRNTKQWPSQGKQGYAARALLPAPADCLGAINEKWPAFQGKLDPQQQR